MFHNRSTKTLLAAALIVVTIPTAATTTADASAAATSEPLSVRADFNGDGYADLAVGVAEEDTEAANDGGVNVIYGSFPGLTATGNQFWSQDTPGIDGTPQAGEMFGSALATGDFNGDGYSDLAVGVQGDGYGAPGAGGVNVIYGSAAGLTTAGNQFWSQDRPGIYGTAETGDQFGFSLAAADFGNSSHTDLAIGAPSDGVGGAVNIIYGSTAGLTATGNQLWSQDSPGILGTAESRDKFGYSLAAADLGNSTHADLAIGVPFENARDDGAVNVIYGSSTGLTATRNQSWTQDSPGILGTAETDDEFGFSLAAADFGNSTHADLAIGVPFENSRDDGAVNVIYGSSTGLTATGNQSWTQDSAGIIGYAEERDTFGFSLAAADFGHSTHADLAIGVPTESVSMYHDGGVNVIYGSAGGLTSTGNQFWSQNSDGIHGTCEYEDVFGSSLVAANFGRSAHADLVVGAWVEDYTVFDDGMVNVIYGTPGGLAETGNQMWSQDSPGIIDNGESQDHFGYLGASPQRYWY